MVSHPPCSFSALGSPLRPLHCLALLILGLCLSWAAWAQPGSGQAPGGVVHPVTERQVTSPLEALGTLKANESTQISSHITKTVTQIHFDDNQFVEKGELLVEMTSEEELALLEEARTNRDEAKKQLDRVASLVEQGAASRSALDERLRDYESAKARFNAVQARISDLRLRAPFSGYVGLRNISVGALVTPGDVVTTLNDDSRMKLDFSLPARALPHLEKGLPIEARSSALGGRRFGGEIYSIDNQVDPITRSIQVRAILPNDERVLVPGLLMTVTLQTRERSALLVSEAALVTDGGTQSVWVVGASEEGKPVAGKQPVRIGERFRGWVEITEGLSEGDRVVTHGLQKVKEGQPVEVIAEDSGGDALQELLQGAQAGEQ